MLPSTLLRSKAVRGLPVLLASLLFAGCGTQPPERSAAPLQEVAHADSGYYLQQMRQSSDDSKTNWQLLAIRALLKEGKIPQANDLFAQLPQTLTEAQQQERSLLAAELKLAQQDFAGARTLLATIAPANLGAPQLSRYWQDVISAEQGKPSLTLLRALIARQPLLASPQERQKNIDDTWQALIGMSPEQANKLVINAGENVLQGWLDLQQVWFNNRSDPDALKAGIGDWRIRYPQNPGAKMLPTQLTNTQSVTPAAGGQIALLLPLNGQTAIFGRTIQQGFEAARNGSVGAVAGSAVPQQVAQAATSNADSGEVVSPAQAEVSDLTAAPIGSRNAPVRAPGAGPAAQPATAAPVAASPATPAPTTAPATPAVVTPTAAPTVGLKIYDTTTQPMNQLLAQAQQDGATLVVGPLLKSNVEALMTSNTTLNVLALNQPEKVENRVNICYFALSPEDEARDAARHIHDQGKLTPLLLLPRGSLGDRVGAAFAEEWQKLSGGVVLQQRFGSLSELKMGVNGGGGIALTGTPLVVNPPPQPDAATGGLTIPAPPAATPIGDGGKVDAAYILATPEEIGFIKPMIAMRNGSQNGVALYASSRSAQGTAGPDFRLEMEGLQFSEIPMLAGSNPQLMQQALAAVHNDYSLARLYAMGVDAWTLANHFSQMRQQPGFALNGNTGDLTASPECVINRKLSWLKYQQGEIVPAN